MHTQATVVVDTSQHLCIVQHVHATDIGELTGRYARFALAYDAPSF